MRRLLRTIAAFLPPLALALATAGCGRDSTPNAPARTAEPPTAQAARDLARHFAATLSRGGVPIDRLGRTSVRSIAADAARGVPLRAVAVQDEIGFSWSLVVRFYDASGGELPAYVPGVTARATALARARGRLTTAEHEASLGIERFLDVRGLLPAATELHADGSARDTASCAFEAIDGSTSRSYDLLASGTLEDLRVSKDAEAHPYPLGGVLLWNVRADAIERDAQGTREAHYEARIEVTFNGTRHPIIEIEERWRFRMDLETGELTELPS